jgi:hypothetical protein
MYQISLDVVQAEGRGFYMCQVRLNSLAEDRDYCISRVMLNGCSSRGQRLQHVSGEAELFCRRQSLLHQSDEVEPLFKQRTEASTCVR